MKHQHTYFIIRGSGKVAIEKQAHDRAIEIGRQIGKLETQQKKIAKILGEGQKGVAE